MSLQNTMLQVADRMSPKLQPTEHHMTVEAGVTVGNREGGNFDVGMTMGKSGN